MRSVTVVKVVDLRMLVGVWRSMVAAAVVLAVSACQQGAPPAGPAHSGAEARVVDAAPPVQITAITLSNTRAGKPEALEAMPLRGSDGLEIVLGFSGKAHSARVEVRVWETSGQGIFRGEEMVEVNGATSVRFAVAAPQGGWVPGRYTVFPVVNGQQREAASFVVD